MKNLYKDWTAESYEREIDQLKRRLGIKEAENKILFREGKSLRHKVSLLEDIVVESAAAEVKWKHRAFSVWRWMAKYVACRTIFLRENPEAAEWFDK